MVPADSLSVVFSTFTLISLAELGDKSQLVCMTLAARHRHWPVILGAASAFVVLNSLAVLFGANMSYATPIAYKTNLLIMSAGGYRFSDFLRVGLPLTLVMWLVLSWLLPLLYGL